MVSSQFGESNRMNRFATDNNDIISGLSRSSAAMAAMNSTLSETIALFTAGQEVLQDSEKMGNALKSVAMRVRGYDESTEELSDDLVDITGKVIDLTKVASNDYKGVSLFTDETQEHYKSIYDYLVQIADVYDELSEKNQQELLEKLFGKYQAQAGAAILSNIQAAKDVMNVIENESAGSADREMEVIKDSVDYAKNELTETLTGIAQSSITRDFEKTILQSLTRVLDVLGDASSPLNGVLTTISKIFETTSKLVENLGLIPSIIAGISLSKSFKNGGLFRTVNADADKFSQKIGILHRSFADIKTDFSTLSKANGFKQNFAHIFNFASKQDIANFQQFNHVIDDGQNTFRSYNTYMANAPTAMRQVAQEIVNIKNAQHDLTIARNQGKITLDEYNSKNDVYNARLTELRGNVNNLTLAQKALTIAQKVGATVVTTAINVLISVGISKLISVVMEAFQTQEKLIEQNKQIADSYENTKKKLEDYRQKYFDIIDSTDDEAEKDKQLIEWKKQLIEQYGFEEEALAGVNDERRTGIALIDEEAYKEAKNNLNNLKDYEKAINNIYDASTKRANLKSYNSMSGLDNYEIDFKSIANHDGSYNVTIEYDTSNAYEQLEQIGDVLSDLKMKSSKLDEDSPNYENLHQYYHWRIEFVQQEYDRIKKIIDDYGATASSALSSQAQILLHDFITDSTNTAGQLANVIDKTTFDSWKEAILNLAGNSEPLKNELEELANSMFPEYSGSVINSTNDTNNTVTAVTSLNDALTKLQELLKDIISGSSTYQSAMQKITTGTGLTAKEVNELLELDPSLFDKFVKQKNGTWTIDLEALRLSYDTIIVDGGKDAIADQVAEYQNEFDSQTARLQELQKEYDELANYTPQGAESPSASSERKYRLEQLQSEIDETKKFIDDAQRDIDLASFQESLLDYSDADRIRDSFDDITKQIDNYNDGITKINKAIENVIGTTVTGSQELDEFNAEMQKNYGLGNVDLTTRPKVELDDGSTATVLSGLEYLWQGNEEDGQYVGVHITPILPNGEVLSDEELSNYIQNILADADNILEADKVENGGKGLVLKVDTDLNLSEVDIASLNSGGELTEHMQEVLTVADEWDNKLHEVQEQWMNLDNTVNKVSGTAILSYDDMTELIELYPELAGKFKETSNGFEIEVQALEKISKQAYQTRDDFIDSEIAMSKVAIEETKVRLLALKAEIEGIASQDEYLVAIEKGTFEKYNNALAEIESLNNYINILESYKSPIKSPENNDKDISNSLQNQIDYYTTLLDAIEAVTDKQIDALEKEKDAIDSKIDALNDEKDALKDKNDEQQRELDLIEAQNNLDKAKKQKVFVYKEGEGLVQVQDEKAVKDAQKELDDVNADIEEAKIDKQIDALKKDQDEIDNQIDALNDYKDSFSDMESNAKDQLAIEQAKKALGVDENGLLHIDETTAKNIRDGLAEAIYNKDVNDNKNNGKYVTVSLADYLSDLGATVTPQQFQAIANTATGNTPITAPVTNSTVNNAQSIVNNKSITLNNTFNVYDSKDSNTVIEQIKSYMNKTLRTAINSIK